MEATKKLFKGISIILFVNIINACLNIITNFLLPKYLSVSAYAGIKEYQLYCGFIALLYFGFGDGMYLEYGGKQLKDINSTDLSTRLNSIRTFEIIITIISLLISVFVLKNNIWIWFSLSIIPLNVTGFFQLLYQATGEFKRYSRILSISAIGRTVVGLLLLILGQKSQYSPYLCGFVIADILIWVYLEIEIHKNETKNEPIFGCSWAVIADGIRNGFVLRISILSGILLSSLDRVFVKILLTIVDFAQYSFAATVENLLNVMVTPVTTTLYNYFCSSPSINQKVKIRNTVSIVGFSLLVLYFPIKIIVYWFLPNYIESLSVLSLLFASKMLYMIIQGVYCNMYKANKQQNKYFKRLLFIILFGVLTNIVFFFFWKTKEAFACATFLTTIIWLFISCNDFNEIEYKIRDIVYFAVNLASYIFLSNFINPFFGGGIYMVLAISSTILFYKEEVSSLMKYIEELLRRRFH